MPLPMEIDPALTTNAGGVHPFTSVSDLLVPEMRGGKTAFGWLNDTAFTTDPAGFTAGFATSARTDSDADLGYQLTALVMTFDSDSDAAAAATVFAADGFPDFGNGVGEPAQSTAHPGALLSWLPGSQYLAGFYPTGRFVIGTLVDNREKHYEKISDLPDLIAKSDKAIAVTEDRLKSFRPTPPDQLTILPLDPLGIVRLTLPRPPGTGRRTDSAALSTPTAPCTTRTSRTRHRRCSTRTGWMRSVTVPERCIGPGTRPRRKICATWNTSTSSTIRSIRRWACRARGA
ncbi:hypothetical protein KHQ06_01545 [Nocardia tengchongensis]|uniref:DUF7373 domain-containing protein n=1 Tax=Nocardia tengchongensis TaxID=2055889 RepID=A0ABX8CPK5_9NOCA|nr:hypothetical protein [Nocardia tengchongensis]QVI21874.1 hypothetical protein KHQ06_01545 [Nocardia tengchongensis]